MGTRQLQKIRTDSFEHLDLSKSMLHALNEAGYEKPTPVQAGMIPQALDGFDVIGQARTGTGKTAAFAIPIIEQLDPLTETTQPQALVLVPTRELAVQVQHEFHRLAKGTKVRTTSIYGGKPIRGQIEKLRRGVQVVIGTPGRIIDHLTRRTLSLSDIWCVVLDEADRMLDIGFRPDIEKILRRCPSDRQTLMFSATMPEPIRLLAKRYMYRPKLLNFSPKSISVDTIEQHYFQVFPNQKTELLTKLLAREEPRQAIIFCRTKIGTERLYRKLRRDVSDVACLHGDMSQNARDDTMSAFRDGRHRLLVATDVVGRGIDVSSISHIINFDVPHLSEDYVHRVGRTGRMGREGVAFTFITPDENTYLLDIEKTINRELKRDLIDGIDQPFGSDGEGSGMGRQRRRHRKAL